MVSTAEFRAFVGEAFGWLEVQKMVMYQREWEPHKWSKRNPRKSEKLFFNL